MNNMKTVYFFCTDPTKDEVAPRVFEASQRLLNMDETDMKVDGYPVLCHDAGNGNLLYYVRTETVLCMAYDRYLPAINELFADCSLAVLVNWHGGQNAPDKVLCIHTVGDVSSGEFGPSAPKLSTNLARALERHRAALNVHEFAVTTEATHWSGIVYGGHPAWINRSPLPFLDVEIGSTLESYTHPEAVESIARALGDIYGADQDYPTVLYCGGMHFEETITAAVLHPTHPVALTHILPSRWLENEAYTGEQGIKALKACIASIEGGIQGFVVHEKLKREQKDLIDALAAELELPVIKRKALKAPETTVFYQG